MKWKFKRPRRGQPR